MSKKTSRPNKCEGSHSWQYHLHYDFDEQIWYCDAYAPAYGHYVRADRSPRDALALTVEATTICMDSRKERL